MDEKERSVRRRRETSVGFGDYAAHRRRRDRLLRGLLYLAAGSTCGLLLGILGYILYRGLPQVSWQLVSTVPSVLQGTIGILPNLINTLYLVVGTLLLALPLGIGAAIYLTEYATDRRRVELIQFATEVLTGIPSILYGFLGMMLFVQTLQWGSSLRAGICTLTLLLFPTILRTTQEALETVPQSWREGALALGSGRWHMVCTVVLPAAVDGIVTGAILSVGRIVGESAALLYTAGSASDLVRGVGRALKSSGGSLTVALYLYTMERGELEVGFAIAALLLLLTLAIDRMARWVGKKLKREH